MKILGAFLISAVLLSSCSFTGRVSVGENNLDQEEVEALVLEGLTESVGVAPSAIDCEGVEEIEVVEGATFECTGTAPAGDTFAVILTLDDDEGRFTARVPG